MPVGIQYQQILPHLFYLFEPLIICQYQLLYIFKSKNPQTKTGMANLEIHFDSEIKMLLQSYSNTPEDKIALSSYFVGKSKEVASLHYEDEENNDKQSKLQKNINLFNEELEWQLKSAFRRLMERQELGIVGQLFDLICNLAHQEKPISQNNDKKNGENDQANKKDPKQKYKPIIKKSLLISFLDEILECVGITDLKNILDLIVEKIPKFGKLEDVETYKLLRIINTLLKRISKTEDFYIRGQLQMTITKILPLCHDSGFRYRPSSNKIDDEKNEDELLAIFRDEHTVISTQFYEEFWELQKYFMNPEDFTEQSTGSQNRLSVAECYLRKLTHVKMIFFKVLEYFDKNPTTFCNDFSSFPLKFMKLPNLLQMQLQDGYFRGVIMMQVLFFTFSLKLPKKNPEVHTSDKKITALIQEIENAARQAFKKIQEKNLHLNSESQISINQKLSSFLTNEEYWIALKDNWKDRKKNHFKEASHLIKETKRKLFHPDEPQIPAPPEQPSTTLPINLKQREKKAFLESSKKLNIQTNSLTKFLKNPPKFHSEEQGEGKLTRDPRIPSFSYFLSQTEECIDSFDYENKAQAQFSTRSQYNIFEWKAYRSLYRQNIKDISIKNVNQNLKQYRLLAMVHKKREDFYSQPPKKVKMQRNDPQEEEQKHISPQIKERIQIIRNIFIEKTATKQSQQQFKQQFDQIDANKDSMLSVREFLLFLMKLGIQVSETQGKEIIEVLDDSNNGEIEYDAIRKLIMFDPFQ